MGLSLGSLSREPDHLATPLLATPAVASSSSEGAGGDAKILETPNLKIFSFSELKTATKNFKTDRFLGKGESGKVFKGWMDEKTLKPSKAGTGMAVAIQELYSDNMRDSQERQSEVNFLGRLYHPNLARLLGYCWEDEQLLLVYEYVQRGSLENHLFRMNPEPLSWDILLKIAIGAARGLAFLHNLENNVTYSCFKASCILLDKNYNAKVSKFGWAKLGFHSTVHIDRGYAAPEYLEKGCLCENGIVYGFGVVLLEMLTGLRGFDPKRPKGKEYLVDWWKPFLCSEGEVKALMDVRMKGQYSSQAALQVAQLTLKCIASNPKSRPSMEEVVEALEGIEAMKEKPEESDITSWP